MSNPFDRFDSPAPARNPFDQFDPPQTAKGSERGVLDKAGDYAHGVSQALGDAAMTAQAGLGWFAQAPAANSLAMATGARALAAQGLNAAQNWVAPGSGELDPGIQQAAQQTSRYAAEQRAANVDAEGGSWSNPRTAIARLGLGLQEDARARSAEIEAKNAADNPELVRQQQAVQAATGFVPTVKAMAENPLATTYTLARSAPDMLAGLGLARAAAGRVLAGAGAAGEAAAARAAAAGADIAAQGAAAKAAVDQVAQNAVARASGVGALAEAASSANSAREGVHREVMQLPAEKLMQSPRFQQVLQETGGDAVKAREILANELADQAPLLAGAGTLAGSAITRRLFGGDTTAKAVAGQRVGLRDVAKNVAEEGTEEGLQGVPEDLAQFGATSQADPSKQFDLGGTLAQNMVAGALMGGGGTSARVAQQAVQDLRNPERAAPAQPGAGNAASPIDAAEVLGRAGGPANASMPMGEHDGAGRAAPVGAAAEMRLAELDLLAQSRDLTPAERTEAQGLLANLAAADADRATNGATEQAEKQDWKAFPPESGTLGVPRAEMPQVEAQHRGALVQFLAARGIPHEQVELDGSKLKPTQAEYDAGKVAAMAADPGASSRSVLVSSDGYVVDGHHQWIAQTEAGTPVKAIRLEAPIRELLPVVAEFPSAGKSEGSSSSGPAEGFVRMYHGGEPSDADGPLWFSADQRYAEGYAKKSGGRVWYVDVPKGSAALGGDAEFGVLPPTNVELPAEIARQRKVLQQSPTAKLPAEQSLFTPGGQTALERVEAIDAQMASRAADSPEAQRLQADRDAITKTWPPLVPGGTTSFSTEAGARVGAKYALIDADNLVTSHSESLRANPEYPQQLQPRDRTRAASAAQIGGIVAKIDPARLGLSPDAATGAPIVGADGIVESGNARSIALKRVYGVTHGLKAETYKGWLRDNAAQFGLTPEAVDGIEKPVLVRVRTTPVNRAEFARQANASPVAALSAAEQARQDASLIDPSVLEVFRPGEVSSAANRDFVRAFVSKARQRGDDTAQLMAADGSLSPAGRQRIQAALMQAAYSDAALVQELFDSLDTDIRSIGEALKMVAGEWVGMRQAVRDGAIAADADITDNLLQAIELVRRARRERLALSDLVRQPDLLSGDVPDPLTVGLLHAFYRGPDFTRAAGREHTVSMLRDYVRGASVTQAGPDLLGDTLTAGDILQAINTKEGSSHATTAAAQSGQQPSSRQDPVGGVDEARPGQQGQPDADGSRPARGDSREGGEASQRTMGPRDQAGREGDEPDSLKPAAAAKAATLAQPKAKGAASIEDAGAKIGGARKDWRERGLSIADLDAMTEAEGATVVTKANVWKPDYAAQAAAGAHRDAVALVKVVYDGLAAKPRQDTPQGRRDYVRVMQLVREVYAAVRTVDEAKSAAERLRQALGVGSGFGLATSPEQRAARQVLFSVYKGRSDPFTIGSAEISRARKLTFDGFPGVIEPWTRRLALREVGGSGTTERGIEVYRDESQALGTPMTEEQLRAGVFQVRDKAGKVKAYAASRADAEAAAKAVYERDRNIGDDKRDPVRPHLDGLQRSGLPPALDRDATAQDFLDDFGFRGIEFGNWAAQDERQRVLNLAHEGLADLALVLNVPKRALSLNGTLGMAFGARGGGKALAHYEGGRLVINLTKLRGAGSLAHEFAHAFDHYLGELNQADAYQSLPRGASGWHQLQRYDGQPQRGMVRGADGSWVRADGRRLPNLRPELAGRIDAVMRALYSGQQTQDGMLSELDANIRRAGELAAGATSDPTVHEVYQRQADNYRAVRAEIARDPAGTTYPKGRSKFAAEAQQLSGKATDGYWLRPTEMFARAFEAYVFDRLVAMGARSEYLVHGVEAERYAGGEYRGNPYPTGAERAAINAAFDAMVAELKTKPGGDGRLALFSRSQRSMDAAERNALRALSENDELFALPKPTGTTVDAVAAEVDPAIRVKRNSQAAGRTDYTLTLPTGTTARLVVREQDPLVPQVYGHQLVDGVSREVTARPGENPEDAAGKGDVWIDASLLSSGAAGAKLYAIAAAYAHNTGRVFIGDPAGLSDEALRRRSEQMLSSALKYGTTDHLAPHPRQVDGDTALGVPPLKWVYGDDVGNIRRLVEVNLAALQNAGLDEIQFAPATGEYIDSEGQPVGRDGIEAWAGAGYGRNALAGGRTLARGAVLRAALGERNGVAQASAPEALLSRLAGLASHAGAATRGILYSRPRAPGAPAADAGISLAELRAVTARIQQALPRLPAVHVLQSPAALGVDPAQAELRAQIVRSGAWDDVEGALHAGELYLFASNIASAERAEHVLAEHEAGHFGLSAMLGDARRTTLQAISNNNTMVRQAATALQVAEGIDHITAVEEILVDMPSDELAKLKGWRKVVAGVRDWLLSNGFERLAARLDAWLAGSLTQQQHADLEVADLVRAARAYLARPLVDTVDGSVPAAAFSRNSRPATGGPMSAWAAAKAKVARLTDPKVIDRLVYEFQDRFVDLKRLQEHIKAIGGTVSDLNDAYLGEELFHKRLAKRTEDFLALELKPLLADLNARGETMEAFERFLHARHAPEANAAMAERNPNQATIDTLRDAARKEVQELQARLEKARRTGSATKSLEAALDQARREAMRLNTAQAFRGTEAERLSLSGMTDADAKALVAGLTPAQRANFEALAARVDAMNAKTLKLLESYGLMSADALDAWRRAYQFYVPLHRDEAHADSHAHPIGQGFNVRGDAARQRVGSNEKVTHILGHIAMQREAALTRGEKNTVVKKLYLLAAQNPDRDYWSTDTPPKISTVDPSTGFVRTGIDPAYKNRPNVVMLRIAGRDAAITFNERNREAMRLAEAIKSLDVGDLHVVLGLVAKATRWFASVNTQYNPIFGLVNFARDVQEAMLNLSTTPLAGKQREVASGVFKAMRAIYRTERGKSAANAEWTRLWEEMQNVGGTTGHRDLYVDAGDRVKALERELKALDRGQVSKAAHAVVDWLSDYNETMENSVRLSAYKVGLDHGMTKERAASMAKGLTVNFNRKGRQTREIGALYAFANASFQGTARMFETLRGPMGKRIMFGGIALGMLNTLLGMAVMGGGDDKDDAWDKIPEFIKERSIIIPLSRHDYATIPMPLGFKLFPNIGRLATEFAFGGADKPAGRQLGKLLLSFVDAFNPLGGAQDLGQLAAPTVLDPVVALMENKDWTGRPIYREDRNQLDPQPGHTLAKDSASTVGRGLAVAINRITGGTEYRPGAWSPTPDQLDYVMGQLTGGLGRELLKLNQTVAAPFTGDELPPHKIPLVGRLYGNTRGAAGQSERFYENLKLLNGLENEVKGRDRNDQDADAFIEGEPLTSLIGAGNDAERQVRALRAERRKVVEQNEPDHREQLREIDERIAEVMAELNAAVSRVRKTGAPA